MKIVLSFSPVLFQDPLSAMVEVGLGRRPSFHRGIVLQWNLLANDLLGTTVVCLSFVESLQLVPLVLFVVTRGEGGLRPPSPLVRVVGATLISSEEVVSSELINLFECNVYIKNKLIVS